ncbi:MAG TPA: prolyl aminopeptidase [Thermoanaerobaculia bacterium]|jgi:proline iminopeptidase|nr:prolyl aminopeptidase [Thermoanaerobaculia bacterium]
MPLFPDIEPYASGSLQVSGLHEIYYEQVGNPEGIPILFLHGGPGHGCQPRTRQYYDPQTFRAVLHDQRGAGRSRPFGEVRENTTQELIGDIEALRTHLQIDKFIILGGSWGSTLALAYAEAYPEHVSGLILRGVFLATQTEINSIYIDDGYAAAFFPEVSARFWSQIPEKPGTTPPQRILALFDSPDERVRRKAARAWGAFENKLAVLTVSDETIEKNMDANDPLALARIENHYMANRCFLEEGQLLRDIGKIQHIPTVIVNGRYDVLCPPKYAWLLHQLLPHSQLWIIEQAGHAGGEPGIEEALVRAVKTFAPR